MKEENDPIETRGGGEPASLKYITNCYCIALSVTVFTMNPSLSIRRKIRTGLFVLVFCCMTFLLAFAVYLIGMAIAQKGHLVHGTMVWIILGLLGLLICLGAAVVVNEYVLVQYPSSLTGLSSRIKNDNSSPSSTESTVSMETSA